MKNLCIIPARGGSKGVPGKNIKKIDGKHLISYSIEAALNSELISTIVVTSDDDNILNIASKYDRLNLHKRNKDLATDNSPIIDTILDILQHGYMDYDRFVLLQPTSPIRTGNNIDEAITKLSLNNHYNSLISVCKMNDIHPMRMYTIKDDSLLSLYPTMQDKHRQNLPDIYFRNGSIYITRVTAFLTHKKVMLDPITYYEMPSSQLLNIDEPYDIVIADPLIKAWKAGLL